MITVLAATYQESQRFGRRAGLGRVHTIASAEHAMGLSFDIVLELPSFQDRRDRHAIDSVIARGARRWAPTIRMLIDPEQYAEVMADPALPEAYPAGPDEVEGQTTIADEVALAEADRMRRLSAFEQGGPVVERTAPTPDLEQAVADAGTRPVEAPEPEFKPRSRARRKP